MAKEHRPGFYFFTSDWAGDDGVKASSFAARGLWIELLRIMDASEPRGFLLLNGKPPSIDKLAKMVVGSTEEVEILLSELEENGVFSRNKAGAIYSRKMVRDENKARIARENGKLGGNPSLRKAKGNGASDNQPDKLLPSLTYPNHTKEEQDFIKSPQSPLSQEIAAEHVLQPVASDDAAVGAAAPPVIEEVVGLVYDDEADQGKSEVEFRLNAEPVTKPPIRKQRSKLRTKDPGSKPSAREIAEGFRQFCLRYPRLELLAAAERRFKSIVKVGHATIDEILTGAEELAAHTWRNSAEIRFIPKPEAWLHGGGYSDKLVDKAGYSYDPNTEGMDITPEQQCDNKQPYYQQMNGHYIPRDPETGLRFVGRTTKVMLDFAEKTGIDPWRMRF